MLPKGNLKKAKVAKAAKTKAPALSDLVEQERECRTLLVASLRNLADEIGEELPSMEELIEDGNISYYEDEIALHGRGIDFDAKNWGEAATALGSVLR